MNAEWPKNNQRPLLLSNMISNYIIRKMRLREVS